MKKFLYIITVLLVTAALTLTLAACGGTSPNDTENAVGYVNIKINPEIDLTTSEDNVVQAVYAANEDAEILLAETELVGMDAEDAIEAIVDLAVEQGYIDEESQDNEVTIGVIDGEEETQDNGLQAKLMERVRKFFQNKGINGIVSEATLDKYAEQAAAMGVPNGKLKMMLRALELNPELDINELKDMEMKDLVALLKAEFDIGEEGTLRGELNTERAALRERYMRMFELEDAIDELKERIEGFEGEESEKAALEAELEGLETEYASLKEAYEEEMKALKDEHKQAEESLREQRKEQQRQKVEQHKQQRGKNA